MQVQNTGSSVISLYIGGVQHQFNGDQTITLADNLLQEVESLLLEFPDLSIVSTTFTGGGGGATPGGSAGSLQFKSGSNLAGDTFVTYNGSQAIFNVVDNYGGFKVKGRAGGEASISLQPDNISDGATGQWIIYTGGPNTNSPNDFSIFNGGSTDAFVIKASNNFIGIGTYNPQFTLDVAGNINASGNVSCISAYFNGGGSIYLQTSQLYDSSGNIVLDWGNYKLQSPGNTTQIQWGGSGVQINNGIFDIANNHISIDTNNRLLTDQNSVNSVMWDSREMHDHNNSSSLNWDGRIMYAQNGSSSLAWDSRTLSDGIVGTSLDWANRYLVDDAGKNALAWKAANMSGATASRPATANLSIGYVFFDTDLEMPVWWSGSNWVDGSGGTV